MWRSLLAAPRLSAAQTAGKGVGLGESVNTLQGQLSEAALPNVLQFMALNGATGCLVLRPPKGALGYIFFAAGAVVHAQLGVQRDQSALTSLMTWPEGAFSFHRDMLAPERTLSLSVDKLLLNAAYQVDTNSNLTDTQSRLGLFTDDTVLVAVPVPHEQRVALSPGALTLLRYIDGVHTLAAVAERSRRDGSLSLTEVLASAEELYYQALVRVVTVVLTPSSFTRDLAHLVVDVMGPLGEIVVEDALYNLQLDPGAIPRSQVGALLEEITLQFRLEDRKTLFKERAAALRKYYDLE